jgi:hypothetical protein
MSWRLFWREELPSLAAAYRRVHEAWLNRAISSGREYPRIPLRRVDQGGFERLMQRPGGPALAEMWWTAALERVDD